MTPLPKCPHILIPETCEYATLDGKRAFADVVNVKDLKRDYLDEPIIIT